MEVPFYLHDLGEPELQAIARVLQGPILTTGAEVAAFEQRFAEALGVPHAVGVTSCTGGLHIALEALGIGAGHEVITTPLTFIATATAIEQAGATPVFVDVEAATGNLDAQQIEAAITPRTRAIVPVHLYGQMCDMKAIRAIADRHGLAVIEDAAHCVEGIRDGLRPGQGSDAAVFSFYATKNLTCGEGGAVVCKSSELDRCLRLLRHHGMNRTAQDRHRDGYQHWDMVEFGWKYNMYNLQAAMLLPQLDRLEQNWTRRQEIWQHYTRLLAEVPGVELPTLQDGVRHAYHLFTVWVDPLVRDRVIGRLQQEKIGVAVNYRAIHTLTYFRETYGLRPGMFPQAERIGARTLTLPFYTRLSSDQVEYGVERLAALVACAQGQS